MKPALTLQTEAMKRPTTMKSKFTLLTALLLAPLAALHAADSPPDRAAFFDVPSFAELPPAIEVVSEKTDAGVKVTELYFAGAVQRQADEDLRLLLPAGEGREVSRGARTPRGGIDEARPRGGDRIRQERLLLLCDGLGRPQSETRRGRSPPFHLLQAGDGQVQDAARWVEGVRPGTGRQTQRRHVRPPRRDVAEEQAGGGRGRLCVSGMSAGRI